MNQYAQSEVDDDSFGRYLGEGVGTFMIALVAFMTTHQPLTAAAIVAAAGLSLDGYSSTFFNPAVTAGHYLRGDIRGKRATWLIFAQLIGGLAGLLVASLITAQKKNKKECHNAMPISNAVFSSSSSQ